MLASSGGVIAQPVTSCAELGREGLTDEQVWSGMRPEELAHRVGSSVHLDRVAGFVTWGSHAELEGDLGAAPDEQSRGAVPECACGSSSAVFAYGRGGVRNGRSSRSRGGLQPGRRRWPRRRARRRARHHVDGPATHQRECSPDLINLSLQEAMFCFKHPPTGIFMFLSPKAPNTMLVFNSPRIYLLWRGRGGCGTCVGLLCSA